MFDLHWLQWTSRTPSSLDVMTSLYATVMSSQYIWRTSAIEVSITALLKNLRSEMKGVQEEDLVCVLGVDRKIRPS